MRILIVVALLVLACGIALETAGMVAAQHGSAAGGDLFVAGAVVFTGGFAAATAWAILFVIRYGRTPDETPIPAGRGAPDLDSRVQQLLQYAREHPQLDPPGHAHRD